jgi:hypothetical protein
VKTSQSALQARTVFVENAPAAIDDQSANRSARTEVASVVVNEEFTDGIRVLKLAVLVSFPSCGQCA